MRARWLLASIVAAALTIAGCSGNAGDDSVERLPSSPVVTSRDGSLSAQLPPGWSQVRDSYPLSLITLASGPVANRIIGPCRAGAVQDELPKGGVLVRIAEIYPRITPISDAVGRTVRLGQIRLGRAELRECGNSYALAFAKGRRQFSVWIWTKNFETTAEANGQTVHRGRSGRLGPKARRQLLRLLNGLVVAPAAAKPVMMPFLALDCRNRPNTIDCDRVWVDLTTRIRMKSISVRIRRWSVKSPDGWVDSRSPASRAIPLQTVSGSRPFAESVHKFWQGAVPDAGLRGGGLAFNLAMPGPGEHWVGTGIGHDPVIRADVEVISPRGRWRFRHIRLIAGHG